MNDEFFMKRALKLAKKAEGFTSPNPVVGAVIVKNGRIVSEGYHRKAGTPHAEADAIANSKESLRGSTLYVTLEPCCHTDKRTPPCTTAIISAGIKKVVVSTLDPNPKVSGKGLSYLQQAGIQTVTGVLERQSERLNEFYRKYIKTGTPFVILKTAMTLDGKIATPEGASKWITSEKSRIFVHKLRGRVDAVLSAIGTIEADNPQFTTRIKGMKDPLRIIIDPELRTPDHFHVLTPPPSTMVITKQTGPRMKQLKEKGVYVYPYSDRLDLRELMKSLGEMGIISVMIEGGSSLAFHALDEDIVDKIMYFIAPKIIGGRDSYPAVGGNKYRKLEDAISVKDIRVKRIGADILIEGYLK